MPEYLGLGVKTIGIATPATVAGEIRLEVVTAGHIGIIQNNPVVDVEPVSETGVDAVQPDRTHGRVLALIIVVNVNELKKIFPAELIGEGRRGNIAEVSEPLLVDALDKYARLLLLLRGHGSFQGVLRPEDIIP